MGSTPAEQIRAARSRSWRAEINIHVGVEKRPASLVMPQIICQQGIAASLSELERFWFGPRRVADFDDWVVFTGQVMAHAGDGRAACDRFCQFFGMCRPISLSG